jgi:hypothetical protein
MKNSFSLCLWRCTLAMGLIAWTNKGHNTPTPPSPPVHPSKEFLLYWRTTENIPYEKTPYRYPARHGTALFHPAGLS